MILAAESAGFAAIVTALGGVIVSLATVYLNSRKQASATGENKGQIDALTDQIASLAVQLSALKTENATLKIQLQLLEAQKPVVQETVQVPIVNEPISKKSKKKKK